MTNDQFLDIIKLIFPLFIGYFGHVFQMKLQKKNIKEKRFLIEVEKIEDYLESISKMQYENYVLGLLEKMSEDIAISINSIGQSLNLRTKQINENTTDMNNIEEQINNIKRSIEIINTKKSKDRNQEDFEILEINEKLLKKNNSKLQRLSQDNNLITDDLKKLTSLSESNILKSKNILEKIKRMKEVIENFEKKSITGDVQVSCEIIDPSKALSKKINELINLAKNEEMQSKIIEKKLEIRKILNERIQKI